MKKILHYLAILFFFTLSTKAYSQLDTLNYVKQFEINKSNYENKPLSFLLSQMTQLQPITVHSLSKIPKQSLSAYSIFHFCGLQEQYKGSTVTMIIYWKNPISRSQAMILSKQNHFSFTPAEQSFYGDKIVENIKVFKN